MILRCNAVGCMLPATQRCKFLDPRRGGEDRLAYTVRYFCSDECQLQIVDELERVAQYARLVA